MSTSRTSRLPAAPDVDPDIVVNYLKSLGVTAETTKAIKEQVDRKRQEDRRRAEVAALPVVGPDGVVSRRGAARGAGREDVRAFARRQGMDADVRDGDNVMAWGILEGDPEKVEREYRGLSGFVGSSWELYRPELEAITFPVFVHCYLTLVMFDHGEEARALMRAWGGEHEARYKDEMKLLKMVTAKEHAEASAFCQLVLTHTFRVKICYATSKLLNAFLVNTGLLLVMHILNTRVSFVLEERSPLPFAQVVRCGPDDAFPAALQIASGPRPSNKETPAASTDASGGTPKNRGGEKEKDVKWAAAPPMEVALMKQTERDAAASGLYYPLSLEPKGAKRGADSASPIPPPATPTTNGAAANSSSPSGAGLTVNTDNDKAADGAGAATTAAAIPTGSAAAAAARARASRVAAASEVTEATARRYGGLRQKQVSLPLKPPPQPDPADNWSYLRLVLRPLDPSQLKDTLSTPEGGARPFLANPLSPHVVMLTFYNALNTLCCLKPTRDGMQVAAGFTDRMVRAWRTAPKAPHPPTADGAMVVATPPANGAGSSTGKVTAGGASGSGGNSGAGGEADLGDTLRFVGHSQPVYGVSWSPDGRFLLSAGGDGGVRLWDMARGPAGSSAGYVRYDGHCGPVWDVAFGPAGYYFATAAADRTACLWSTDCASPLRIFAGHLKGVLCVAFHPNANYVVTGSMDKTVRVWDVQTGNCVRLLAGHAGNVTCVAVSPGGRQIAAGSSDKTIRVWDLATGAALALFKGHKDDVESLDFSAEGSALVSGSRDNSVKIWDVASACRRHEAEDGVDPSASLADQMKAAAAAAAAAGGGEDGRGGALAVVGTKRKKGAGGSGGGGVLWSPRGDGPSHGPVHSFGTRNTGVVSVLFTKKNLVIAAGVCRNKT
eukprot:g3315.t1